MSVFDDIATTIKELNDKSGYIPVGLKVCKKGEEDIFWRSKVKEWVEDRLVEYRHKHGLERLKDRGY